MTLGQHIRRYRRQNALTLRQVADDLRVTRQAVSLWECDVGVPEAKKLALLLRRIPNIPARLVKDALLRGIDGQEFRRTGDHADQLARVGNFLLEQRPA